MEAGTVWKRLGRMELHVSIFPVGLHETKPGRLEEARPPPSSGPLKEFPVGQLKGEQLCEPRWPQGVFSRLLFLSGKG